MFVLLTWFHHNIQDKRGTYRSVTWDTVFKTNIRADSASWFTLRVVLDLLNVFICTICTYAICVYLHFTHLSSTYFRLLCAFSCLNDADLNCRASAGVSIQLSKSIQKRTYILGHTHIRT